MLLICFFNKYLFMCLTVGHSLGHNGNPGAPCLYLCDMFLGQVQGPMEPRLWGSGKPPRGSNAVSTLKKGKTRFLSEETLGDLNFICYCC